MPEHSPPMDHVDRRQIVLHEIRSSQVQNVQIADRVQFLLRRMQPGDWSGAFRDMRAVATMARSQVLNFADNFKAVITTAAWKSKPTWMLVAGADRTINPDLERWYAARANSHKVEVAGASHAVYVSRAKEVAALIEEAASR